MSLFLIFISISSRLYDSITFDFFSPLANTTLHNIDHKSQVLKHIFDEIGLLVELNWMKRGEIEENISSLTRQQSITSSCWCSFVAVFGFSPVRRKLRSENCLVDLWGIEESINRSFCFALLWRHQIKFEQKCFSFTSFGCGNPSMLNL